MILGMALATAIAWGLSALDSPAFSKADRLPTVQQAGQWV